MILDALLQLSDAQALTSSDDYSTNTIDFGNVTPKRRVGAGEPLSAVVVIDVAAAGDGGSLTNAFDIALVESANENLGSHVDIITRVIPASLLVAGAMFEFPMPCDKPALRYVGMRYELGADDTLTVSTYVMPRSMVQAWMAYRKNYSV